MNLWDACETVARQKRGLPETYTICAIDLTKGHPKPRRNSEWVEAHVELGIRVPKTGRQKHDAWTEIVKVVLYPVDVAALLAEPVEATA